MFLQDWELVVLHKLRWELSSTIGLDYLDHILPRLPGLPPHIDTARLRIKTETILTLAATHTQFLAIRPSLLAASSILTALLSANLESASAAVNASGYAGRDGRALETILGCQLAVSTAATAPETLAVSASLLREVRLCLQILTHTGAAELELICRKMRDCLPAYLTGQHVVATAVGAAPDSPDTTLCPASPSLYPTHHHETERPAWRCSPSSSSGSDNPDAPTSSNTTAFPFSFPAGADVFSDLKNTVLEAVLHPGDEAQTTAAPQSSDSLISNSILVT